MGLEGLDEDLQGLSGDHPHVQGRVVAVLRRRRQRLPRPQHQVVEQAGVERRQGASAGRGGSSLEGKS